jgi:hypothetical protein
MKHKALLKKGMVKNMPKELNPMNINISSIEFLPRYPVIDKVLYYRNAFAIRRRLPKPEVPVSERYTLSIEEAAVYYGIGQKRLRYLIADDPTADYLIAVGNRTRFKRRKFEEYLDNATCI